MNINGKVQYVLLACQLSADVIVGEEKHCPLNLIIVMQDVLNTDIVLLSQVLSKQVLQALTFKSQDFKPNNADKVDCKMLVLKKEKLKIWMR